MIQLSRRKNGSAIWVRDFARVVRDEHGQVLHYEGTLTDITEQKQADAERQVMFEIIQGANVTANLDELLRLIHQSLKKVLYAENCFVALYDRKTGLIESPFFIDQFDPPPPPTKISKSCTSYVFRTGRPQLITQPVFRRLVEQGEVELVGTPSPCWLGVPLKTPSETIGVLVVQHYHDPQAYTERDVEFLASVGGQIALAIERKRAEEALRQSRQQYQNLVESICDIVYSIDRKGRFTYLNPAVRQIAGYEPEELMGKPFQEFVHPEDQELTREFFAQQLQADGRLRAFRAITKSGEVRFLQSSGRAVVENGRVSGVTGILRDVTEQRRAEARFARIYDVATRHEGQELFERAATTLAELIGTPYVFIGELEKDSRALRALAFYDRGHIDRTKRYELQSTPCERVVLEHRLCVYPQFVQELFPPSPGRNRSRVEAYIGAPIIGSDGSVVGIVNAYDERPKDFTETEARILQIIGQRVGAELERLRSEEARYHLEQQLLQSQKMEAIGTLAGGIAHDFNNMLAGITGYTSLLKMQIDEEHSFYPAITTIEQSADRAAELTKQLLGFARGGKYQVDVVNLNQVVDRVQSLISRTFDRAIQIETCLGHDVCLVDADAGQIEQCLLNLTVNARDAMPNGGRLIIETKNVTLDEEYVRSHLGTRIGRYVKLCVTDTGLGMDQATRSRIFEPFFTTKERGKGTGMGLAMVYGIVNNHGGHIEVDTELGHGTCFRVYFPASAKEERVDKPLADRPIPGGVETILVVDDEQVIRDLSRAMLESFGYTVITAANGEEALRIYADHMNEVGLVILDMIMPGMSGETTYDRLRKINPAVPVLLSSGYSANERVQAVLAAGAKGFIQKPYDARHIAEAVRSFLDEAVAPSEERVLELVAERGTPFRVHDLSTDDR